MTMSWLGNDSHYLKIYHLLIQIKFYKYELYKLPHYLKFYNSKKIKYLPWNGLNGESLK